MVKNMKGAAIAAQKFINIAQGNAKSICIFQHL